MGKNPETLIIFVLYVHYLAWKVRTFDWKRERERERERERGRGLKPSHASLSTELFFE
jgi:hypothetical protein